MEYITGLGCIELYTTFYSALWDTFSMLHNRVQRSSLSIQILLQSEQKKIQTTVAFEEDTRRQGQQSEASTPSSSLMANTTKMLHTFKIQDSRHTDTSKKETKKESSVACSPLPAPQSSTFLH